MDNITQDESWVYKIGIVYALRKLVRDFRGWLSRNPLLFGRILPGNVGLGRSGDSKDSKDSWIDKQIDRIHLERKDSMSTQPIPLVEDKIDIARVVKAFNITPEALQTARMANLKEIEKLSAQIQDLKFTIETYDLINTKMKSKMTLP